MKETQLQKQIVDALNYKGCMVWRVNSGMLAIGEGKNRRMFRAGTAGQSDIQGIHKKTGRFIGFEVKLPERKKYTTELQEQFLQNIKDAHGISGVVTSVEEALQCLKS